MQHHHTGLVTISSKWVLLKHLNSFPFRLDCFGLGLHTQHSRWRKQDYDRLKNWTHSGVKTICICWNAPFFPHINFNNRKQRKIKMLCMSEYIRINFWIHQSCENLLPPLCFPRCLFWLWHPANGFLRAAFHLSGTISDLSTSWEAVTLCCHTAATAEVSLICHRASAPRLAMLARPAEWNLPWQQHMIDMTQPGNEAIRIQITQNGRKLMLNAHHHLVAWRGGRERTGAFVTIFWSWSWPTHRFEMT